MESFDLGIIGTGAMGSALLRGIVGSRLLAGTSVIVYDADAAKAERISKELGCVVAPCLEDIPQMSRRVLLAVKPHQVGNVVAACVGFLTSYHLVISIAAGVRIQVIKEMLPAGSGVVRVMPNTPALVGEGMTALSFSSDVSEKDREWAKQVFACVGQTAVVSEAQMDAVTAVSGSGPAYVYLFLESLIDAAVTAGLPQELSRKLALQTVLGTVRMVIETGKHPAELKAEVTSPGGTTAAGLRVLEREGTRSAVIEAVLAAKAQSESLGRE